MSQDQPVMRVPVQQQVGQLVFTQPSGAPPIRFSPFGAQQQYQPTPVPPPPTHRRMSQPLLQLTHQSLSAARGQVVEVETSESSSSDSEEKRRKRSKTHRRHTTSQKEPRPLPQPETKSGKKKKKKEKTQKKPAPPKTKPAEFGEIGESYQYNSQSQMSDKYIHRLGSKTGVLSPPKKFLKIKFFF